MAARKTAKLDLIERAGYLFRTRGYHNTSISDIAKACQLSKASIYHHITSKQELGVLAIKSVHEQFKVDIFAIAYEETLSEKERLVKFAEAVETLFIERDGGCLMGNMALEVSDTHPEFVELFKAYFDDWTAAVAHLLKHKYGEKAANYYAADLVAYTQGAIMMSRLHKTQAPLKQVTAVMSNFLDNPTFAQLEEGIDSETVTA